MRASGGAVAGAVLLPPLGVHLAARPAREFWIAGGLTLLGFLPGMVYALARVLGPQAAQATQTSQERAGALPADQGPAAT